MATGGVLANGTKVGFSTTSPHSWTVLTQIREVQFPQEDVDPVDTTVHGSSRVSRSAPGMIKPSAMVVRTLLDPDLLISGWCNTLRNHLLSGTTLWWRVEVPRDRAQTNWLAFEFQGYVRKASPVVGAPDNIQQFEVVVEYDYNTDIDVLTGTVL
jgi:hypothetical protein